MTYFLDTDICIFALRGRYSEIPRRMESLSPQQIKIPAIVKAELLIGAYKSKHPQRVEEIVQRFLFPFEIIPFCDRCALTYASARYDLEKSGKMIGPNDLMIAATVLAHNGILITHNSKEFARVPEIMLEDWI